ncbi:MAG: Ferredoxin--NADP reductase [Chlamydiae bacterium]|nr:Ferredoxin--NADP reductase [Chlamydiota bacterium]
MSNCYLIVIGGGAAGIFAALRAKKCNPDARVLLLEKTAVLLAKVRISGGGRCNVTHSCFDPKELTSHYPRGNKELLGPFHRFGPKDTIEWFQGKGITLKTEKDGRIFPATDSSETIIQCLLGEAKRLNVEIGLRQKIQTIEKTEEGFCIHLKEGESLHCKKLLLATGSSSQGYEWAKQLGHTIQKPLPSLFTFNVPTSPLKELSGISATDCELHLKGTSFRQRGPVLITHFGFSGPAVIKLSAWAAPYLFEKGYKADLIINWMPGSTPLPKRLMKKLKQDLHADCFRIEGKTTHREEFVTCGGVTLNEINFKTMESKICPGLYFAGEILNIDGVTGGFNFQNAWTTGFLAGS